jgi:hypothetical protein
MPDRSIESNSSGDDLTLMWMAWKSGAAFTATTAYTAVWALRAWRFFSLARIACVWY